tara:strand:- start:277 stop:468 length:192 start_codon:yes stop_codon:yes gene_type:complete
MLKYITQLLNAQSTSGKNIVGVIVTVNMENVMNNLTKEEFMKIYNKGNNLIGKPIFINFYATW